jgi:hypothetical protein
MEFQAHKKKNQFDQADRSIVKGFVYAMHEVVA